MYLRHTSLLFLVFTACAPELELAEETDCSSSTADALDGSSDGTAAHDSMHELAAEVHPTHPGPCDPPPQVLRE